MKTEMTNTVEVSSEDANNYSKILRLLGMEEEGDPVAEVSRRLVDLDTLVSRFLTWPVPADVYPDGTPGQPGRTGTNLLSAPQAKAMLQHVLGG